MNRYNSDFKEKEEWHIENFTKELCRNTPEKLQKQLIGLIKHQRMFSLFNKTNCDIMNMIKNKYSISEKQPI